VEDVQVGEPQEQRDQDGMRKNSHRGAELKRATTGHATLAMITPITVNFA